MIMRRNFGKAGVCVSVSVIRARHLGISWLLRRMSLLLLFSLSLSWTTSAQTSVLTQHNDNMRTGLNPNETALTTSNVNVNQFGKLFALAVDGKVYAQPLYAPNVSIAGVPHNILIVVTEADTVYAFDADSNTQFWMASMLDTAHGASPAGCPGNGLPCETAVSSTAVSCTDTQPVIGITSTPVIDQASGTVYVEAKSTNGSKYFHRLHGLDLATGNEKSPGPVVIGTTGPGGTTPVTVNGTGDGSAGGQLPFDAQTQLNRPGLLLLNGTIYLGYGSHCDRTPYHGWMFAYDAATFAFKSVFASTPNGRNGGYWNSGAGVAADANGNIFIATGNGTFDTTIVPAIDVGDSVTKLGTANANLSLVDYFTPSDQATLEANDQDLGAGGVQVLPDQPGTHPHLLVTAGKEGRIYVIDRDQMTRDPATGNPLHYCTVNCNGGDPQIVEESSSGFLGTTGGVNSLYSLPAYWNSTLYYWARLDVVKAIPVTNGLPDFAHIKTGSITLNWPGATPSISSNGTTAGTAILWAIDSSQWGSPGPGPGPAVLHAIDATNVSSELWNSTQAQTPSNRDKAGNAVKFTVPTIANGKVYVPTASEVDVYGLLIQIATPQISPASETFCTAASCTGPVSVSITDATSGASIYYTTDGSLPSPGSGTTKLYTAPFTVSTTTTVNAIATLSGSNSLVATATYTLQPVTMPTISPASQTFCTAAGCSGPVSVSISDTTNGAAIYYTTDGSTPNPNNVAPGTPTQQYTAPFTVSTTSTVNAIATLSGYANSAMASATYTLQPVTTPTITPGSESFSGSVNVSITDTPAPSAAIYYTTDGSLPSPGSGTTRLYNGPLTVSTNTTVKAIATQSGYANSNVASATYSLVINSINFGGGFTSTSGLQLNGSAAWNQAASRLQLTNGGISQAGSVFSTTPANVQSFTTDFSFQLTNATADGMTFAIQNSGATALGPSGGGLGYGAPLPGGTPGIPTSVAIKFDLHSNAGEGSDSTGLYTNGASPTIPAIDMANSPINLHSGDIFKVHITYDGTWLLMTITDATTGKSFVEAWPVNIPSVVGGSAAFIGFTGGTGTSTATQEIVSWTYAAGTPQMLEPVQYEPESAALFGASVSSGPTYRVIAFPGFTDGSGTTLDAVAVGDNVTIPLNVPQAGSYDIKVATKKHNSRGIVQLSVNGTNVGPAADQYSGTDAWYEFDLGSVSLAAGSQPFKFTTTGKNAASSSFSQAYDYIKLIAQ
jgi:Legume lectin domain/Chitobiase/beta-hexosaminidase C-terminal domain